MYKVFVTGGSSMIGRAICERLIEQGHNVYAPKKNDCNLFVYENIDWEICRYKPDYIIHAAGWNGGIAWNKKYPADIYGNTITMAANLYLAVTKATIEFNFKVKGVLGILASCSYPDNNGGVFFEEDLHDGLPNETVECHGLAKRVIADYGRQVEKQYGIPCRSVILTNAFGPGDSFHLEKTKVVGALIRKFVEAKRDNLPSVTCWGTGSPKRQLIYSKDAGRIIADLALIPNISSPINVGSYTEITIKELTEVIAREVGYTGNIEWDTSKPDGQMRKYIQIERLKTVLDVKFTPFRDAIKETIEWYINNKEQADAKLF